jgi:sRNA-binding carbon storage regulator CsrA
MSDTANKHLFLHRRVGQVIHFETQGVSFSVTVGNISTQHNNVTLNILAPQEVQITRGERLGGEQRGQY